MHGQAVEYPKTINFDNELYIIWRPHQPELKAWTGLDDKQDLKSVRPVHRYHCLQMNTPSVINHPVHTI